MFAPFSVMSLEAQKLISVSIGKINASRVTRTGTSLHKSLLVASVLHKARNIYLEEERERVTRYPMCAPELTVTPVCQVHDKENRLICHEDEVATAERVGEEINRLPLAEANTGNNLTNTRTTTTITSITNTPTTTTTTTNSSQNRKRRRVSDQETAAAISSILPKRLRSELKVETSQKNESNVKQSKKLVPSESRSGVAGRLTPPEVSPETQADCDEDNGSSSDSDGDDSASDTSTSSCDENQEMEVDQLTSLVSYFSFSQSQKNNEFCSSQLNPLTSGPHVLALTA